MRKYVCFMPTYIHIMMVCTLQSICVFIIYLNVRRGEKKLIRFIWSHLCYMTHFTQSLRNIQTLERKKAFVVILSDESCMFQCASRADMEDWCRDIQRYSSGHRGAMAAVTSLPQGSNAGDIYEGTLYMLRIIMYTDTSRTQRIEEWSWFRAYEHNLLIQCFFCYCIRTSYKHL